MVKAWNDSSKRVLRPYIVKREWGNAAKAAIFMPADTCYCVQEALKQGSITRNTKLLIIDRNRLTLCAAYHKLVAMGFHQDEIYMFCGDLKESSIEKFENSAGKKCDEKIEFIYLDTCGELTEAMYEFIRRFLKHPNICKKCTLAFTFSNAERASKNFLWGVAGKYTTKKGNSFSNKVDNDVNRFVDLTKERKKNTFYFADKEPIYYAGPHYYTGLRCSMINNALNKIIGKTHMLAIGRAYKEEGPSVPMFTARYEPKRITHFRKYDKLVPKNLGYK